jgi:hypothetical protein
MLQMTIAEVRKLQAETGHVLVVEDFELIEELDAVSAEVALVSPQERRLLRQPLSLCGIDFWPLTVAKTLWFNEKIQDWDINPERQEALMLWLLTLPNTTEALDKYAEKSKVDASSRKLARKLHCSADELASVYLRCMGRKSQSSEQAHEEGSDIDYGGFIAVLLKEYGGTVDKWLYETPVEMLATLFSAHERRVTKENEAINRAKAHSKGHKAVAPVPTKRIAALHKFRDVANKIREAWNGEK